MKAIVHDRYGEADVLRLADVPKPVAQGKQVLVQVRAAGVDIGTWHLMAGRPYMVRLATGLRGPRQRIRGRDVAGVVEAVGPEVTRLRPGDEVYGTCDGSFAEYAVGAEKRLTRKPANLSFEEAAVVPISAGTAYEGLRSLHSGERALIIGAAGAVGSFAVQLAKARGAHVTGVCSTSKVELVRELGADKVIDYTREEIPAAAYEFVLDTAGNRSLKELRRALTPRGTLVIVGAETEGKLFGGIDRGLRAMLLSPFVGQRLSVLVSSENFQVYDALRELVEAGQVMPVIDRRYSLAEAPDAVRRLTETHARGKLVITV
ncbi:NADPH:quinone reductase-like Zn-dependent oxidoreductase [Kribbella amoyensis]|uniref:NADPH:quinone reductase-like Zn-dependent oxidoreductase n=1 Tax=Kribbella amoyensis TaxID=996641 RepID=A0A561C1E2_9ACTN|nr:NAD(P)-dependent alcohol dehydrogenase [Kribbella amoyensis]TWD84752.1 NADPH:quinone reductase-like Zn-dependent oxidoreductase [Kribbella amoyensis]